MNPLPDNMISDLSYLEAFADEDFSASKMVQFFFFIKVENIVDKGENAGYQHVFLFHTMSLKAFSRHAMKVSIMQ